ncbi:MAG: DUF4097 family beta strand repeat-containing protein [Lachnospiraceae bacterium]|nr:DUF4097 family beta strand repeat-containing protein [Lachnospiraceae bacterium]
MKAFYKNTLVVAIALFALSGFLFLAGIGVSFFWYGTDPSNQVRFQDDLDSGLRQFSEFFDHVEFSRHGIIYAGDKNEALKYTDVAYSFTPDEAVNLSVETFETNVYIWETYTDKIKVTTIGNISFICKSNESTLTIMPESFDYAIVGEKPSVIIEVPKGYTFNNVILQTTMGSIEADNLIADSAFLSANRGIICINKALVAESEANIEVNNLSDCYINCIATTNLNIQSNVAIVTAGVSNSLRKANIDSNLSRYRFLSGTRTNQSNYEINESLSDVTIIYEKAY